MTMRLLGLAGYLLLFAWLDWLTHRSIVFVVIAGGAVLLAVAFGTRIGKAVRWATLRDTSGLTNQIVNAWTALPWQARRLAAAAGPLLYFLLRGQGTSNAGGAVLVGGLLVAVPVVLLGEPLDRLLHGFYLRRDQILPRWLRAAGAPVLAVLLAFTIVHGSLLDLPALFGGTTNSPQSPVDLTGRIFAATVLAAICAVLLVRERNKA